MGGCSQPGAEGHTLSVRLVNKAVSVLIRHYQLHSGHVALQSGVGWMCNIVTHPLSKGKL